MADGEWLMAKKFHQTLCLMNNSLAVLAIRHHPFAILIPLGTEGVRHEEKNLCQRAPVMYALLRRIFHHRRMI
jgi:hypothetical protein